MKENRKYIFLLAGAVLLIILVEWLTPKPINWTPTFSRQDKIPFGSHVVYEMLPELFPGKAVRINNRTLYENQQNGTLPNGNYVFVNDQFRIGEEDAHVLLDFVHRGNHAFIAAQYFDELLEDTLGFRTESVFFTSDSVGLKLTHPQLKTDDFYSYRKINLFYAFAKPDSVKQATFEVLGVSNLKSRPNFIRIPFGKGYFYLNSVPLAYTNYNMLAEDNARYISGTLSYLPVQNVYWDEHYKAFGRSNGADSSQTPLRFFLSQPPLRWGLYLTLGALLLFMLFEAKRKQRIIPIVQPLANTTVEFTETVGRLYYQYKDHKNIAEKKITYFLAHLRTQYYVKTTEFDEPLYTRLAEKTGVEKSEIVPLFQLIERIRRQSAITEPDLLTLNEKIESFLKKSA